MSYKLKRPATATAATRVAVESHDAMSAIPSPLPLTSATVPAQSITRSGGSVIPSPIAIVVSSRAAGGKPIPPPSPQTPPPRRIGKGNNFSSVLACFERVWEEDRKRKFVRDQSSRPEANAAPTQCGAARCWFAPPCRTLLTGRDFYCC